MNWKHLLICLLIGINHSLYAQSEKQYHILTVAFYNLENLFDYEDDPITFDDDRTPNGKDHWTSQDYNNKLVNMAKVLADVGRELSGSSAALIGLCEVENRKVLEDLINTPPLSNHTYGIVHFDSPDRRGIDVALLYRIGLFLPTHYKAYELKLFDTETSERIYTRNQLLISGLLNEEPIHLIINHWPSRRGGEIRSAYKRIKAAQLNRHIMDSLLSINPYAKILSMGDFNDDPIDTSIKQILKTHKNRTSVPLKGLYNPMEKMFNMGLGTLAYKDSWNLFDQIIISEEWLKPDYSEYRFYKAGIFNKNYLTQPEGRFKSYPFKSFTNGSFSGGYSDHFPVYVYLIKEI